VNSPIGGMGLNSGVHDAFNLADKFARIWKGEDADALLSLYERQRRHIAVHSTQAQTIRNKKLLAERDPAVRKKNHDELRRQSEDSEARARVPAQDFADPKRTRSGIDHVDR
jgi:3-(3-hydroxy-phenyl)propionate hydroxylase